MIALFEKKTKNYVLIPKNLDIQVGSKFIQKGKPNLFDFLSSCGTEKFLYFCPYNESQFWTPFTLIKYITINVDWGFKAPKMTQKHHKGTKKSGAYGYFLFLF